MDALMKYIFSTLFLLLLAPTVKADCFVERNDAAAGVLRCEADKGFTIKLVCLPTSKSIAARSNRILTTRNAKFSIGNATWTSDLISGKSIRLARYNKRKKDQDFYGLGHDYSTIVSAMEKGKDVIITYEKKNYVISLSGFTKSYNEICL